jgi:hypothetical protein
MQQCPAESHVQQPQTEHPVDLDSVLCGYQVWSLGQPTPNFTLEGHEKGVNAVDYFVGGASLLLTSATAAQWLYCCHAEHPSLYQQLEPQVPLTPLIFLLYVLQATGHS